MLNLTGQPYRPRCRLKHLAIFPKMHARFENECAVSEKRGGADFQADFFKRLTARVDDHEFAMGLFASSGDFATSDTARPAAAGSIAKGRQR